MHKDYKNKHAYGSDQFLCSMPALSLLFFFVTECSVLTAWYVRKGNDAKNSVILGFFNTERTQLNAVHAQLLKKLGPIAFAETRRFLTIRSIEF